MITFRHYPLRMWTDQSIDIELWDLESTARFGATFGRSLKEAWKEPLKGNVRRARQVAYQTLEFSSGSSARGYMGVTWSLHRA